MAFITIDGERQIAKKQGDNQTLNIATFVLANIENLGEEPATRIESIPDAEFISDQLSVTKSGYVSTNQVVYSLVMGSDIGDYDFNWVGMVDDEGVLIAVSYIPTIKKRKNDGGVPGNTITRNFLLAYTGIQQTTAITVPAETWQIDFTARLVGIDERERLANFDIYGHEGFLGDGWKVTGSAGTYSVAAGVGYVGGIRVKNEAEQEITTNTFPNEIWLNVSLQGDISDMNAVGAFVIDTGPFEDYIDENGVAHYLTKLASVDAAGGVSDERVITYLKDLKSIVDKNASRKRLFTVSGDANNIVLTTKDGETPVTELSDFDEFSFIVTATNTSSAMTIKIDDLDAVTLSGISSDTQIFETALLTVRYIDGAFYVAEQVNPKTGSSVADIAKLITDTTDVLYPGEYALDGSEINSVDHPIACAKAAASSNYIAQVTKDSDPVEYAGYYGFIDEVDGSTTVTLPMVGGEFIRMFDAGRGVDDGRVLGSWKQDAIRNITGSFVTAYGDGNGVFSNVDSGGNDDLSGAGDLRQRFTFDASTVVPTADENRPRSIAYYGKTRL